MIQALGYDGLAHPSFDSHLESWNGCSLRASSKDAEQSEITKYCRASMSTSIMLHVPNKAIASGTSNPPQNDVGNV